MKSMYTYALVAALIFGAQLDAKNKVNGKIRANLKKVTAPKKTARRRPAVAAPVVAAVTPRPAVVPAPVRVTPAPRPAVVTPVRVAPAAPVVNREEQERFAHLEAEMNAMRTQLARSQEISAQNEEANRKYFAEKAKLEQEIAAAKVEAEERANKTNLTVQQWAQEVAKLEEQCDELLAIREEQAHCDALIADRDAALKLEKEAQEELNREPQVPATGWQKYASALLEKPFEHPGKTALAAIPVAAGVYHRQTIGAQVALLQDWANKTRALIALKGFAAKHPHITLGSQITAATAAVGSAFLAYKRFMHAPVVAPASTSVVTTLPAEAKPGYAARFKAAGSRVKKAVAPYATLGNGVTTAAAVAAGYYGSTKEAATQAARIGQTVLHAAGGTAVAKGAGYVAQKALGAKIPTSVATPSHQKS